MNGLEREFSEQLAFEQRAANTEDGKAAMRAYGLRAHPSYVIVAPDGQLLWQFTGPLNAAALRQRVCQYGGQCQGRAKVLCEGRVARSISSQRHR